MEENGKGMTTPQWVKDACAWQAEDDDNRSVLIIATEGNGGLSGCGGTSTALIKTMIDAYGKDSGFKDCFEKAMKVITDPTAAMAFGLALNDYIKQHSCNKE